MFQLIWVRPEPLSRAELISQPGPTTVFSTVERQGLSLAELSSNVVDGGASGGVLDVGFAVDEAHAADHVAEAGGTVEAAPATLSALAEPEDHG